MRALHTTAIIGVALLVAGCTALVLTRPLAQTHADWAMFGGTPERSSSSDSPLAPPLAPVWDVSIGAGVGYGSPVTADSLLLVTTLKGEIHVVQCITGKYRGSLNAGAPIAGSPVVAPGCLVVGMSSPDQSLAAYDLEMRAVRWKKSYGDIEANLLLYGERIFAGTLQGVLDCVEPSTGTLLWSYAIPDNFAMKGIRSAPAGADSLVVFGADDGAVYALGVEDGKLRWRWQIGSPVESPITLSGGAVYAGALDGSVACLDLRSGTLRWKERLSAPVYAGAVVTQGLVVYPAIDGTVNALDVRDGRRRWTTDAGGPVNATPLVAGEYLYFGTLKKELLALRVTSGECVWRTTLDGRVKTAPAYAYGTLFIATDDRSLLAFREGPK